MEEHSLARNAVYNIIYKMLNIVFPLISSAYVARILMAESIGKVAAAQNIVSYFTLAASMGIPTYGIKLIAQFNVNEKETSKAFWELFVINGVFSLGCSVAFYLFVLTAHYFDGKEILYCVTGLNVVFNIINVDWFYQGIQEYAYITKRSFFIKCVSFLCLISFVRSTDDYIIYALINTGAVVGNYIFNIIKIKRYVVWPHFHLNFSHHLKPIFTLFAASIATEVYVLADTTMLDILCDPSTVGYYTMSLKIVKLIRSLVAAISAVFLPQMSYLYHNGQKESFLALVDKGFHILMTLALPAAMGLFLISDDAINTLFGSGFAPSILTTRILAVSIVTVALSNYIGMQILVTIGQEKITTLSTVCGAVTNIFLNYFLIRTWRQNGAAVASIITEGIVMFVQLIAARKYIHIHANLKHVFLSLCGMVLVVFLSRQIPLNAQSRFALTTVLGMFVYVVLLLLQKDPFISAVFNKIRKKG